MKNIVSIIALLVIATFVLPANVTASGLTSPAELEGFAWSGYTNPSTGALEGVGWISMNCSNDGPGACATSDYKVQINPDGSVTGYGWSPNVGWIKFGGLSAFPTSGNATVQQNVTAVGTVSDTTDFTLEGWARVCSATVGGDCSSMTTDPNAGGWDGWISMSGETEPSARPSNGAYDILQFTSTGNNITLTGSGWPRSILYNADGTVLYMVKGGGVSDTYIMEYSLSTPYDALTAVEVGPVLTYAGVVDGTFITGQPEGIGEISFNNDGTILYSINATSPGVLAHQLAVPYDISSAGSPVTVLNLSSYDNIPRDMEFDNNGDVLYILGESNDQIYLFDLSTPFDVSSATYNQVALNLSALDIAGSGFVTGILFNDDGTKLFISGFTFSQSYVYSYTLGSAYDITTATGPVGFINYSVGIVDMLFNNTGTKMYGSDIFTKRIREYEINSPVTPPSSPYGITFTNGEATADSFAWGGPNTMGWIDFSPVGTTPVTVKPPVVADIVINGVGFIPGTIQPDGTYDVVTLTPDVTGIPDGVPVDWDLFVGGLPVADGTVTGNGLNPTYDRAIELTSVPAGTPLAIRFEVDMPVADSQVTETNEINQRNFTLNLSYPPPVITFSGPQVIRSGEQADITVTVTAPYDVTCTFAGPGFPSPSTIAVSGGTGTATERSSPLQNATRFEVSCTPGTDVYTEVYQVEVIPTFQEI